MDNLTSKTNLLPCPFCGGEASYESVLVDRGVDENRWGVGCSVEGCIGFQWMQTFPRKRDAAAAWNKRAAVHDSALSTGRGQADEPSTPPVAYRKFLDPQYDYSDRYRYRDAGSIGAGAGWEPLYAEPRRAEPPRAAPWLSWAEQICREADEYLNRSPGEAIHSGSYFHREFKRALSPETKPAAPWCSLCQGEHEPCNPDEWHRKTRELNQLAAETRACLGCAKDWPFDSEVGAHQDPNSSATIKCSAQSEDVSHVDR